MDPIENHMDMIQGESITPYCEYCGRCQAHDKLLCAEKTIRKQDDEIKRLQADRDALAADVGHVSKIRQQQAHEIERLRAALAEQQKVRG